jgi:hypothetical protein
LFVFQPHTHTTETWGGLQVGERLLIATNFEQSNYLPN